MTEKMIVTIDKKEYLQIFITITEVKKSEKGSIQKKMERSFDIGAIYRKNHLHIHGYFLFIEKWIELEYLVPVDKINEFTKVWHDNEYEFPTEDRENL